MPLPSPLDEEAGIRSYYLLELHGPCARRAVRRTHRRRAARLHAPLPAARAAARRRRRRLSSVSRSRGSGPARGGSAGSRVRAGLGALLMASCFQCPSETTSTSPSTTLMAVSSSIAYAGRELGRPLLRGGHGVLRQVRVLEVREDREVDDAQRPVAAAGRLPVDEVLADRGVITMLPALTPDPDRVAQRRQEVREPGLAASSGTGTAASPPFTSRTSVSRTSGTQRSSSRLGSAVSSSTPTDFHPSSDHGGGVLAR